MYLCTERVYIYKLNRVKDHYERSGCDFILCKIVHTLIRRSYSLCEPIALNSLISVCHLGNENVQTQKMFNFS